MIGSKLKAMVVLLAGIVGSTVVQAQTPAALIYDSGVGVIRFAAGDLKEALRQNGYSVSEMPLGAPSGAPQSVRIILTTQAAAVPGMPATSGLAAQGYAIQRVVSGAATNWWVIGHDPAGAMYGGLELAEAVKLGHGLAGVTNRQTNPYLANRGVKFNIPLDARTPTYSEHPGPAAGMSSEQSNVAEMWSMDFWTRFLDEMARHRYNVLSLWSLSPFPSLVRVPEYPKTALADVQGRVYNPTNSTWSTVTLKTMTMDEKITFWRQVMQYARNRGVDVYVYTWNIFVYGTEDSGYGLTDAPANAKTKDWVRRATRTLFDTYPLLTGIGVTAGEHMGGLNNAEKEQWCWDTFGLGVADAVTSARNPASPAYAPNRVIRLIHRAHQASLDQIVSYFKEMPGYTNADCPFTFSFKYSQAHMYSSTKPQIINQGGWFNSIPAGKKTWLTVRNDDMFYLRWGDPDFARSYLTSLPDVSKLAGFYMGPDGYCWGREFLSKEPDSPRQQVIDKMWYSFLLWGRLSYDPTLPNGQFQALLGDRFPEVSSAKLFAGWASVSKILPLVTRFYWGDMDFKWYPEACWSKDGFSTVQDFITPKYDPMNAREDGQSPRLMSVKDFVSGVATNDLLTPLQAADLIEQYAEAGLRSVNGLTAGTDKELRFTLGDIKAMAWLGRYYAEKIRGAVDLCRYQKAGNTNDHQNAVVHLQTASTHWSRYAALWSTQYVGQVLIRLGSGLVDMQAIQTYVDRDIQVDRDIPQPPSTSPPKVSFSTPTDGQKLATPAGLSVLVNASQPSGSIANVKLYVNGTALHTEGNAAYQWDAVSDAALANLASGVYTLMAVATDKVGNTNSARITITIGSRSP